MFCQRVNRYRVFFLFLPFEKYRRQAVISSSIDTLAVRLLEEKRSGGHAKTTCREEKYLLKRIASKVQSGKCPSQGGLWRAVCHDPDSP